MSVYAYIYSKSKEYEAQMVAVKNCEFAVSRIFIDSEVDQNVPALSRPALKDLTGILEKGDVCVFVHIGCFGSDKMDILRTIEWFHKNGVANRVLQMDGLDVTTPYGKMVIQMIAAVKEWEEVCPVF